MRIEPGHSRAEARRLLTERFRAAGLAEPQREAAALLARATGLRPLDLAAEPERRLGEAASRVEAFAARREAGEPLSRIAGEREFWSLPFRVTPDVLDPRADTETLVEAALAALARREGDALRLVDFGVGTGAILAALLAELPNARGLGVDRSEAAAKVARDNLEALGFGARAEVRVGNWGEGLAGPFDLIVSNPPYIPSAEIATLAPEVREHDPRLALDGGADGLDPYRALAPEIARLLAASGVFALEHGLGQGPDVRAILAAAGLRPRASRADLAGIERVQVGSW